MIKRSLHSAIIIVPIVLICTLFSYLGLAYFNFQLNVTLMIVAMSLIVMLIMTGAYILGHQQKLGFLFLGTVVFKMFGVGYLAVFQEDFKLNVMPYFLLFWVLLAAETVAVIFLLRKQDINHVTK